MRPSSSIFRALTWRWRTPTATVERTMSAVGVKTASERLRQRSASSPASERASGGARVRARVEEEIMTACEVCIYRYRGGTALLHRCPWRFASEEHVAIMQHIGVCSTSHARLDCRVVVPTSPGFRWRNEH